MLDYCKLLSNRYIKNDARSGLIVPQNRLLQPDLPNQSIRSADRKRAFEEDMMSVVMSSCTDTYYRPLGIHKPQNVPVIKDIAALIKHACAGGNMTNDSWKERLPEIDASVESWYNLDNMYMPFTNELLVNGESRCIFVSK